MNVDFETISATNYLEFSVIYSNITSNDYSDEEKYEMMDFLKSQTREKQVETIRQCVPGVVDSADLLGERLLQVLDNIRHTDEHTARCKELFLDIFDSALNVYQEHLVKAPKVEIPVKCGRQEVWKRDNDNLKEEIKILKQELDEKNYIIDQLEVESRRRNVKSNEFDEIKERNSFLISENTALKSKMAVDQRSYEITLKELKQREEKLICDINALKDSISVKGVLLKSIENEKEVMFTDFQLLSEEVVERDLIIQSLNEAADERKENVAFLLDMTSDVHISGEELTSTAKLKLPSIGCDNCSKKSNSVSFLNVSLRRRNVPSPIFDDSEQSLGLGASSEVADLIRAPRGAKSISDELLEANCGKSGSSLKKILMTELIGKMYLLELDLKSLRTKLNLSNQKLLSSQRSRMVIRYRVESGKLTKMMFSKYEGVRMK